MHKSNHKNQSTKQAGISHMVLIVIISIVGVVSIAAASIILLMVFANDKSGLTPQESTQNLRNDVDETKGFAAGTPATFGPFTAKVNDVTRGYQPGNGAEPKYPGNEFLLINITMENTSSTNQALSETGLGLLVDDVLVSSSFITVDPKLKLGVVAGGETVEGNLLYEVPSSASKVQLYYYDDRYDTEAQQTKKTEYTLDIEF